MDGPGGNGNDFGTIGHNGLWDYGKNGEKGENCGKINIHNSLKVKAYGGRGGSGGSSGSNSGGGGRRLSSSWNWRRRSRPEAGADAMNGGRRIHWWKW